MSVLKLLMGGGTEVASAVRQFTDRTYVSTENRVSSVATTLTARSVHKVRVRAENVSVVYGNVYPNPVTVGCAVETGGTLYQLSTSTGATKVTLQTGQFATFGPLDGTIPAGANLPVRTYYSIAAGADLPWARGTQLASSLGEGEISGQDLTLPGSAALPADGSAFGYTPLAIRGKIALSTVVVAALGDSITERGNDTAATIRGFIVRALDAESKPFTNYAKWGQAAAHMYAAGAASSTWNAQVGSTLDGCTHVVCAYGRNDLSAALTDVKSTFLGLWGLAAASGRKVWQTTVTPSSTSTDVWATTASQTPNGNNDTRIAFNDWLRDGAPTISGVGAATGTTDSTAVRAGAAGHPLKGYLEVADTVESARNSGIWKPTTTDDGVHPTTAGHLNMLEPIRSWAAGLTV